MLNAFTQSHTPNREKNKDQNYGSYEYKTLFTKCVYMHAIYARMQCCEDWGRADSDRAAHIVVISLEPYVLYQCQPSNYRPLTHVGHCSKNGVGNA